MSTIPSAASQPIGPGFSLRRFLRRNTTGVLFILPLLAFLLLYQMYPILRVLWLSFTNYRNLYPDTTSFVGLRNYTQVLQDPVFWQGIGQAAEFTAIFIPGGVLFPVLLAILLDRVRNA